MANHNYVMICGESSTGKTTSLMNMKDPEGVLYLNCEINKPITFRNKFKDITITDPMQVYQAFQQAESREDIHTIVIDSLTFLMSMYETVYVSNAKDTRAAWGNYQKFFKELMYNYIAKSSKRIIVLAHTADTIDMDKGVMVTQVPVKGALRDLSVEAFFSIIVISKKMTVQELEQYPSDLLNISEREKALGYKYVFQVNPTQKTAHYRVRGPIGLFDDTVVYMDNDAEKLLGIIQEYYA